MASHLSDVWFSVTDLEVASGTGCWVTDDRRCRVPRLHRGHRGRLDGALPSEGDAPRSPSRPATLHPRAGELLPPRPARAARRPARRDHPGEHRHVLLRELGCRDHRSRGEAREADDGATARHRVLRQLPRSHAPHDGDDDVEDGLPRRLRTVAGRCVRRPVPRSARRRRGRGDRPRARGLRPLCSPSQTAPAETAAIIIEPVLGEGGYIPAPARFLQGLADAVRAARHPVRRRRGADRVRAHGRDVRGHPRGHRARRAVHGEGHRVRASRSPRSARAPSSWRGGRRAATAARTAATRSVARPRSRRSRS